ncbi:unnamed protein product [Didymodactylos carnosus]|nr:unnamed protein product [Didymodactylos carnosus]CAF3689239.1 unnamed protein product [Didymodactylos carnosus]
MGRQYSSGSQDVSIDKNGCVSQSIVIHELLHTVGFAHEQSRPDRDSSVAVQWTNIQNGQSNNFQSFVNGESSTLNQPYDLGSIMHYKWNAFSKNGQPTLLPTSATVPKEIMGAAKEMITLDIRKVKQYYNCQ